MPDFIKLLDTLRKNEIFVCIDYVVNHVAKEHSWAKAALEGDVSMQEMFIMYDTDEMPIVLTKPSRKYFRINARETLRTIPKLKNTCLHRLVISNGI
jgi:glycosidase